MFARGTVVNIEYGTAYVDVCEEDVESCGACAISCDPRAAGKQFEVEASEQMKIGSAVTFRVKMPSRYLAVTMLLLLPLVLLVVGIFLGRGWFGDDLAAFGVGVAFFLASFSAARLFEAYAARRGDYKPTVVAVEEPEDATDEGDHGVDHV